MARVDTMGLRARKKERTRRHIADAAARLFGERGYDAVAVTDVAREAEVAEQTVYNYFPTKERLVLDREDEIRDHLVHLVRTRGSGTGSAAAIRGAALADVENLRRMPPPQARGSLAALAAASPAIRRFALEATERQADALVDALVETTPGISPSVAKVHAIALAWVFHLIVDEAGRRLREGSTPAQIADVLTPMIEDVIDDLDRRFGSTPA